MKKASRITALILAMVMVFVTPLSAEAASRGYAFRSNGATAYIGARAKSFIKKQGKPQSRHSKPSCVTAQGDDVTYRYKNFYLYTYTTRKGGAEYVNSIKFRNRSARTDKGIHIGSTERQMKSKYGRGTENYGVYTYKKGKMAIKFTVDNGKVSEIEYSKG